MRIVVGLTDVLVNLLPACFDRLAGGGASHDSMAASAREEAFFREQKAQKMREEEEMLAKMDDDTREKSVPTNSPPHTPFAMFPTCHIPLIFQQVSG